MFATTRRVLTLSCIALVCFSGCTAAREPRGTDGLSAQERQLNLESFDKVWETVRDRHWDADLGGLDWVAVREELRPQVETAESMRQAREIIESMVLKLEQSHFAIIPGRVYGEIDHEAAGEAPSGAGVTGIRVRIHEGRALVVDVDERLGAASLGILPGWQVVGVRGVPVETMIETVDAQYRGSTLREAMTALAVENRLAAPAGGTVQVEFLDGADERVVIDIPCARPPGTPARLGHLPPMYMSFDSRRIGEDIGYIRFNLFFDPATLMRSFAEALGSFRDTAGIILDLRGNPGGIGAMAMGIGGWFVERKDQYLGTMITRETALKFVINPRAETYRGPLAILVDGLSMSTSEILAGGLQELGRARVFGTPTAGAALPSIFERLPSGDGFQYAFANYVSVGGEPLEGRGVVPDVRVTPDRAALLAGRDNAIDAAVEWIRSGEASAGDAPVEP